MLSVILLVILLLIYVLGTVAWRLHFSPISRFPGSRLAAATFWYEFYHDVVRKGKYTWKIKEMHETYGPVIRINPYELHISDPRYYDNVYVGPARRTDKWSWSAKMFGTSLAAVGTTDHDLHRLRRSALNPFFSKRSVRHLEPVIQRNVNKLSSRLKESAGTGKPVSLAHAFASLSADVISSFAFGKSYDYLSAEDFHPEWHSFMMDLSRSTHLMKQFGWAYEIMTHIPEKIVSILHPLTKELFRLRNGISCQIVSISSQLASSHSRKARETSHPTIFHDLLNSSLPPQELTLRRLTDEALTLIGAGTVTTAHTLTTTVYHILSNPTVERTLRSELANAYANRPERGNSSSSGGSITTTTLLSWQALEQLPYLSAIISEGLRLSYGVSHRLQRISPDMPLTYRNWTIPPGTPVSMTQMFIHQDPQFFPSPLSFLPERWLSDGNSASTSSFPSPSSPSSSSCGSTLFPLASDARAHLHPFSRGTRACIGHNLAYAELYLTLGALFAPPGIDGGVTMELFDTREEDVRVVHDYFNPAPREGTNGVRVLIKG